MKLKHIGIVISIIVVVSLFDNNFTLLKTCMFGGCYGPFKMVVKTTSGEHVEDVILKLTHRSSGFIKGGGPPTYEKIMLVNTDEEIIFPRGYVYWADKDMPVALKLSVYHPDYQKASMDTYYVAAPNRTKGVLDLGDRMITSAQNMLDKSNAESITMWRNDGLSEKEINKKLEGKRVITPGYQLAAGNAYFSIAVSISREDIVDKYLPEMLRGRIKEKNLDMSYEEFNEKYREKIWKRAERY